VLDLNSLMHRLTEAGCTPAQIAIVANELHPLLERDAARLARKREGMRKCRARGTTIVTCGTTEIPQQNQQSCGTTVVPQERKERKERNDLFPHTPLFLKKDKKEKKEIINAHARDFDMFWHAYPRHDGRKKAFIAFQKALTRTDLQTILNGVRRYISTKPDYQDWKLPTTWLNGEHWNDEGDTISPQCGNTRMSPRDQRYLNNQEILNALGRNEPSHAAGEELRKTGGGELGQTGHGPVAGGDILEGVFRRVG